jgi:hypothetical protein
VVSSWYGSLNVERRSEGTRDDADDTFGAVIETSLCFSGSCQITYGGIRYVQRDRSVCSLKRPNSSRAWGTVVFFP